MVPDIERALEDRIQLLTSETNIAWWGRRFVPEKGMPYLAAQITARSGQPIATGTNAPEMWQGFLQLLVVHPASEGPRVARTRALAVRDHFPRGLTLSSGQARVIIETRSMPPAYETGDWLNYPVIIGWFCEESPP